MLVGSTTTALKTFMPCDSNFHHTPPARPGTGPGPRPRAPGRAPALGPGPRARGRFLGVRVPFLVCVCVGGIPQHSCWFHPRTIFGKKCFLWDFLPGTIFYISRWDLFFFTPGIKHCFLGDFLPCQVSRFRACGVCLDVFLGACLDVCVSQKFHCGRVRFACLDVRFAVCSRTPLHHSHWTLSMTSYPFPVKRQNSTSPFAFLLVCSIQTADINGSMMCKLLYSG